VNRSVIRFVAGRRKEHHQRLWERRTDLYEHILLEAGTWGAARDRAMRTYRLDTEPKVLELDDADRHRTRIRLLMFGRREVRLAFERYAEAHWRWAGCHQVVLDFYELNRSVNIGERPEYEAISTEQIEIKRNDRLETQQDADAQETELRRIIEGVVRRRPTPDRWFRRAPRTAWRYLARAIRHRRRRRRQRKLQAARRAQRDRPSNTMAVSYLGATPAPDHLDSLERSIGCSTPRCTAAATQATASK
jgi:hypothetical protein